MSRRLSIRLRLSMRLRLSKIRLENKEITPLLLTTAERESYEMYEQILRVFQGI